MLLCLVCLTLLASLIPCLCILIVGGWQGSELPASGHPEGERGGCHIPHECEGGRQLQSEEPHSEHCSALRHQGRLGDTRQASGESMKCCIWKKKIVKGGKIDVLDNVGWGALLLNCQSLKGGKTE